MKIKKLEVIDFRHIKNQTLEFGQNLTVIAGQNSTGKTSLLGWVAQACKYKGKEKTLIGSNFLEQYSNIFRFCPEKDYSNVYEVNVLYEEDNKDLSKKMRTRYTSKTEKGAERYRIDYDARGRSINFPILYLGLKRLVPLATERSISLKEIKLSNDEKKWFSRLSNDILILNDKDIGSEGIKSKNKQTLSMKTKNHGHLGNSAGQDNIGQIITFLLSFRRLKTSQGANYKGGILLIDEIDATLYAGSQIKLIENLYNFSRDLNIQIIFTTHSLEILEELSDKVGQGTIINFLELRDKAVYNKINPSISLLKNKIKAQSGQKNKIRKMEILCEDKDAELWAKNLLNKTTHKDYLNILEGPFGEGTLTEMADKKHPIFKEMGFILDGDCREKYQKKGIPARTIFLPGKEPPEVIFYNFLQSLSDDDRFWIEDDELNFSKQVCFKNHQKNDLNTVKKWFNDDQLKPLFGKGYSRLFNRWKERNPSEVLEFQNQIKNNILEK